jgi:arylsulfatase A-like enzyme
MTTSTRRDFLRVAVWGAAALAAPQWARAAAKKDRPNIIYIMSDDHAAQAISAYSDFLIQTPHLDRLAKEGLRCDRVYATNSICTPSRATILTGQYSHLNGVPCFNPLDPKRPTVAKYLQAAGYHTLMIGKWHLGSDPVGFDDWEVLPGQGVYHDPIFYTAEGEKKYPGYVTEVTTDLALQRLEKRPKGKPFFAMVHHKAPHRPWEPCDRLAKIWRARTIPEPATLWDDYATRTDAIRECKQKVFDDMTRTDLKFEPPADLKGPQRRQWLQHKPTEVEIEVGGQKKTLTGTELKKWKYQRYMQDYLACCAAVDESVGRILEWLDKNQLAENTMVIYTSDQGFFLGEHGLYDKRFMYEDSARMPFLVRWPRGIKPGTTSAALGINCDFAPTFLDLAGEKVPADMQGRSLVPLFGGTKPDGWRTSFYYRYYHDPGDHNTAAHYGVRTETHKLMYFWRRNQWECFDLVKDPLELKNIYDDPAEQATVAKLKAELQRLREELGDTANRYANNEDQPKETSYVQPGQRKKKGAAK